jgi:ketosteroid isomerase-like protein
MAFEGPLEDRLAIQELVASYGDAVSRQDIADWGALWAEDSLWRHPEVGDMMGRADIVARCADAMARYPLLVFLALLGALKVQGDRAEGRAYSTELVTNAEGATYRVTGRYDDIYVRQGERWLFARRIFTILHSG